MSENDWGRATAAMSQLSGKPLLINDAGVQSISGIRSEARRVKHRLGDLGVIVVDYLQLTDGRSKAESRQVEVAEAVRGLKTLARELDVPVVALSQLSRNLE